MPLGPPLGSLFEDAHDAVRFGIWQRTEQQAIHKAEHGRIRADRERDGGNRDSREARAVAKPANGVTKVVKHAGGHPNHSLGASPEAPHLHITDAEPPPRQRRCQRCPTPRFKSKHASRCVIHMAIDADSPKRRSIPELVQRRWYQFVVSHRAMRLKAQLLLKGGPHVSVMSTPWYPDVSPREAQARWWAARAGRLRPEDV